MTGHSIELRGRVYRSELPRPYYVRTYGNTRGTLPSRSFGSLERAREYARSNGRATIFFEDRPGCGTCVERVG